MYINSAAPFANSLYSDSALDRDTTLYLEEDQEMRLFRMKTDECETHLILSLF